MIHPTLRQLEYAVAVADLLHFRKAAEACHVSQPALSNQIAELEQRLGCQLFERGKSVVLTGAGEELVERARHILAEASELERRAHALSTPFSGRLRLGTIPTMAPYLLPHVIPALQERFPNFDLVVHEEQTHSLLDKLRKGEADLLFLALPLAGDEWATTELFDEEFALAIPANHALASARSIRAEQLAEQEVLLLDDGHCFRDHALEVCQLAGAHARTDVRAAHLGTLVELVRAGLGITLLPKSSLPILAPRLDGVRVIDFTTPPPTRRLGLAFRNSSGHRSEYEEIGVVLREALSTLSGLHAVAAQTP